MITHRWRDKFGVVHSVIESRVKDCLFVHRGGFIPVCRAKDSSIWWKHSKGCPLPINCMTCLVIEARGG